MRFIWRGEVGRNTAVNRPFSRSTCEYQYCQQPVFVQQGWNRGVQSGEASDITAWIILYIILHKYIIYINLKLLLSEKFDCQKFLKRVS